MNNPRQIIIGTFFGPVVLMCIMACSTTQLESNQILANKPLTRSYDRKTLYQIDGKYSITGAELMCTLAALSKCERVYQEYHPVSQSDVEYYRRLEDKSADSLRNLLREMKSDYVSKCFVFLEKCDSGYGRFSTGSSYLSNSLKAKMDFDLDYIPGLISQPIGMQKVEPSKYENPQNQLIKKYNAMNSFESMLAINSVDESAIGRYAIFIAVMKGKEGAYFNGDSGGKPIKLIIPENIQPQPYTMIRFFGKFSGVFKKKTLMGTKRILVVRLLKMLK